MTPQLPELPAWFFWIFGILVFANFGTIIAIIVAIVKFSYKMGGAFRELHLHMEKNTRDVNSAHEKIRDTRETVTKIKEKLIQEGIIGA